MSTPEAKFPVSALIDSAALEKAARALADADGKSWGSNVSNVYRGLALVAVRTYLASASLLGGQVVGNHVEGGAR
jgi:hypothetical protein